MEQTYTQDIKECPFCGCLTNVLWKHPAVKGKKVTIPGQNMTIGLILACSEDCAESLYQKYILKIQDQMK